MNNKKYPSQFYYSGNYKDFSSSVPETSDKDQIYTFFLSFVLSSFFFFFVFLKPQHYDEKGIRYLIDRCAGCSSKSHSLSQASKK